MKDRPLHLMTSISAIGQRDVPQPGKRVSIIAAVSRTLVQRLRICITQSRDILNTGCSSCYTLLEYVQRKRCPFCLSFQLPTSCTRDYTLSHSCPIFHSVRRNWKKFEQLICEPFSRTRDCHADCKPEMIQGNCCSKPEPETRQMAALQWPGIQRTCPWLHHGVPPWRMDDRKAN